MAKAMPKIPIDFNYVSKEPQWYTVVTTFNCEVAFAKDFMQGLYGHELLDKVEDLFVPIKEYKAEIDSPKETNDTKEKNNTKVVAENQMSLYVFVKVIMTERMYWYIRNNSKCAAVLAIGESLCTMSDEEINKLRDSCIPKEREKAGYVLAYKSPYRNPINQLKESLGMGTADEELQKAVQRFHYPYNGRSEEIC